MDKREFNFNISDLRSTSDKVCDTLRRAIITQAIPAGERLVEAKIAKDLGVSITPVRQAFAQLSNQGLLTVYPFKGTNVTVITRKYVNDVLYVRKLLEPAALELCFGQLTEADAQTLRSFCDLSDDSFEEGNLYAAIEYDLRFHNFFFDRCGNELLASMWNSIKNRIQYIQSYSKPKTLPKRYINMRHGPMIDAIRRGDKRVTIDLMINHLETSSTNANLEAALGEAER